MNALNSFQNQRAFPVVPKETEILPIAVYTRIALLEPLIAKEDTLLDCLISGEVCLVHGCGVVGEIWMFMYGLTVVARHEYRIRSADLNANSVSKGHVSCLKVVWPPSKGHGVERHDQSLEAVVLRPLQERERDLVCSGPVWVSLRPVSHGLLYLPV